MSKKNTPQKGQPAASPSPNFPSKAVNVASENPKSEIRNPKSFESGFWRKFWLPVLIFPVLAFLIYHESLRFGYVLDDSMVIEENRFTKRGFAGMDSIFSCESMVGYFGEQRDLVAGGRYRPLSIASFAAEVGVLKAIRGGEDWKNWLSPKLSHAINILLYGLTGSLLFALLLAFFPLKNSKNWLWSVPFLAALVFVLHPIHSEAVANIKGRDEILALLGSLGALWFCFKFWDSEKKGWLVGAFLSFLFGIFSKENAITFLAVVPLTGWFFGRTTAKNIWLATAPILVGSLIFLLARKGAVGFLATSGKEIKDLMNNPFAGMGPANRLATVFLTLGWYLKLLVFPHPLTHDYYPFHVPKSSFSDWKVLLSLVVYVGGAVWALLNLKRKSVASWCILFFLATLSIVSNLPFSIGAFMNERFVYMSSVAFCVLFAWFLVEKLPVLLKKGSGELTWPALGATVLFAVFFAGKTIQRVPDWENALTLNGSSWLSSPGSARSNCFYAVALWEHVWIPTKDRSNLRGLVDTMEMCLNRSLEIYPNYQSALQMKAGVVAERYGFDKDLDRLLADFRQIVERKPSHEYPLQYCEYLLPRSDKTKLADFCRWAGYEVYWKKLKRKDYAKRYLNIAAQADPMNAANIAALAEVQK